MNFFSFSKSSIAKWLEQCKRTKRKAAQPKRSHLNVELLECRVVPAATTLPSPLVSNPTSVGGGFSPQIAIDPLNPLKMVEVHATGGALAGNYTTDGGQTWTGFSLGLNIVDPSIAVPVGQPFQRYAVAQSPSISFDLNEDFYVVSAQHNAANTSGAIVVTKFDFSFGSPNEVSLDTPTPQSTTLANFNQATTLSSPMFDPDITTLTNAIGDPDTTITAAINNTATTFNVVNAAVFGPVTVPFSAIIDSGTASAEVVTVTDITGNTLTVTRAPGAVAHAINATIRTAVGTVDVQDAAVFGPFTVPFSAIIDSGTASAEVVTVTGITGNTLTVTRAPGAGAVPHAAGATVRNAVETVDVQDPTVFGTFTGPFSAIIGSGASAETVTVTGISGNTLTVTRAPGAGAVPHSAGATVRPTFTFTPDTATTIDVASSVGFSTANGPFVVTLAGTANYEQVLVTNISGTTWTVQRGHNGTTAVVHPSGTSVTAVASPSTTLASPLASGSANTTMTVRSSVGFSTANGPFVVSIGGGASFEQVLVTNISGTTWTVVRGHNGTTAVAHGTDEGVTAGGNTVWALNDTGVLYRWLGSQDVAYNPVVAVDTNLPTYTDPVTGAVQTDTMANMLNSPTYGLVPKGVFVAWNTNFTEFSGAPIGTLSRIMISASADGGHSFTTTQKVTDATVVAGAPNHSAPQIIFTQGEANLATSGGLMKIFYNSGGGVFMESVSLDGGVDLAPVAATQAFSGDTGTLEDADFSSTPTTTTWTLAAVLSSTAGPGDTLTINPGPAPPVAPFVVRIDNEDVRIRDTSGTLWTIDARGVNGTTVAAHNTGATLTFTSVANVHTPVSNTFTANVNIDAANLTSITDLDVVLAIQHMHLNELRITLTSPTGDSVVLVRNRTDAAGNTLGQGLPNVANLGVAPGGVANPSDNYTLGTVFDDDAERRINDANASTPYVGHFRPETGSLSLFEGMSLEDLNGTWTLEIADFRNNGNFNPQGDLRGWTLHFTGLFEDSDFAGTGSGTGAATVASSITNVYSTTNTASAAAGIAPGVSIAIDNTLGGLSPYQGRMYMVYTGGGGSNTDVFLRASDNGGISWFSLGQINDDTPLDNFSEGNRAQFQPTVAVDPVTGTVVITYYDARNDAANQRVATAIVVSTDGGDTFSPVTYLNEQKTATDFLTGEVVSYGPIPGNQPQAGAFGFGDRQGLAVYGGNIYPMFATNLNSGGSGIYTATVRTAGGPRVVYGDMGPITEAFTDFGVTRNSLFASDGTRQFTGFVVQFDRLVDVLSFTLDSVKIQYQDPNTGAITDVTVGTILPLDATFSGRLARTFIVRPQTPQSKVGTYSYSIDPRVKDGMQVATRLAADISDTDTTITVTSHLGINPTTFAPVIVQIGTEQLAVIGVSGNTWTVIRGFNSTTPTTHVTGDFVATTGNLMDQNSVGGVGGVNVIAGTKSNVVVRGKSTQTLTTLFNSITAAATTFDVNNFIFAAPTPADPLLVRIGSEQMLVTDISGFTWTVIRGVNGTTAAPHAFDTPITTVGLGNFFSDNDYFAIPKPINGRPFIGPYDLQTLPLIVTGPHLVDTSVPNNPSTSDNLVLNKTNNAIDVTFDRDISAATFTAADVLSIIGPQGAITGPFSVEPLFTHNRTTLAADITTTTATTIQVASNIGINPTPANPILVQIDSEVFAVTNVSGNTWTVIRGFNGSIKATHLASAAVKLPNTFRIGFPTQTLSGTYQINLSSDITDLVGNKVDTNLNAGLDLLRGFTDPANASIDRPVFNNDVSSTNINQIGGLTALAVAGTTFTVGSTANFPATGNFPVQINNEQILVTRASATSLMIVERGYNGTTVVAHGNAATVTRLFEIPTSGTLTSTLSISQAFTINQSTTRSFFDGLVQTTLDSAVSATTSFIDVVSNVGFPINSPFVPFVIQIGTEQIRVNSVSGTFWSVTRGFNNTQAAFHGDGVPVLLGKPATIELELDVDFPDVRDLTATLTSPTGEVIKLFTNPGQFGAPNRANFVGTVFDDAATSPIQLANTPITTGPFNPQTPLSALNGLGSAGTWTLTITNNGVSNSRGILTHWELRLPRAITGSGLGEAAADRFSTSFRIFTQATTNAQSTDQWTAVGPAAANNGANSSRIGGLAVDPSDPSGNTVFVAGASGGIWKTTNFLTSDPNGPTYVMLTDLGPGYSLNIGSLAVFGRNNDPDQTVVFAATGEGDVGSPGVGFLRSMDGGRTWQVLDSTNNVDGAGNVLPMASPLRNHLFVGSTSFKIAVDPTPLPGGHIAVYAALAGTNGGLWRSIDSGNTWARIRAAGSPANDTNVTDVVLAPGSRDQHGNITVLYAAFRGIGVQRTASALSASAMIAMPGGQTFVPRVDPDSLPDPFNPILTAAPSSTPNGAKGRIVLATPALTNDPLQDFFYRGWVYAAVVTPGSTLDGVYLTKDFGFNWTKLNLPAFRPAAQTAFPTNNETRSNYDPLGDDPRFAQGNYDISFAIDPNNPNITYLGGTNNGASIPAGGMIRIDATLVDDPYTLSAYTNDAVAGGIQTATVGPTALKTPGSVYGILDPLGPSGPQAAYRNLYRTPSNPFATDAALEFRNVASFRNTGHDVRWMPFNDAVVNSTDQHELVVFRDPITGATRLIFGDDQGVWTGVDRGDGTLLESVGSLDLPTFSRNGNLQINQFYYGAAQPSTLATDLAAALFYGQAQDNGSLQSDPNVLSNGNIEWSGPGGDGTGVGTDQTGSGIVYRYNWPCCNGLGSGNPLNFFMITQPGLGTIGRTSGLIQTGDNPATGVGNWPFLGGVNFAVNLYDGSAVAMSSPGGRVFLTAGGQTNGGFGLQWDVIAEPAVLNNSYAGAIAFGAPIPAGGTTLPNSSDFIYAGTAGGRVYVTFNRGSSWQNISTGLDGSSIQQIVTNPKKGSYEAYAVTRNGVYWMKDSHAASPVWVKINDVTTGPTIGTTTLVGDITATATTITVAPGATNFPGTPFVIQIGLEQLRVTKVVGDTWTVDRGFNMTLAVAHNDGNTIREVNPLFGVNRPVFNNPNDPFPTLKYLTTIQADWRVAIPDDFGSGALTTITNTTGIDADDTTMTVASAAGFPTGAPFVPFVVQIDTELIQVISVNAAGTTWTLNRGFQGTTAAAHDNGAPVSEYLTHPVLYVGGEGGIFRSTSKGQVWTNFPNVADDGAPQEGGFLPNANVSDLDLALGNFNTQTGFYDQSSGYNALIATTYGRGTFAIRLDNSAVSTNVVAPVGGPRILSATPNVAANGTQFTGYDVTFAGNVDPSTFGPGDVTVTRPNGQLIPSNTVVVFEINDGDGNAQTHKKYRITFPAQTGTGNYTLKIGPDVRDFSGSMMDQNANNVNGQVPGDVFTNVFNFVQNAAPTVTNPGNKIIQPSVPTTNGPFAFTVGDAETPAGSLVVSATSSNPGVLQNNQITFGGSGANRTISFTPSAGANGSTIITLTVTDGNGLATSVQFTVTADEAPTFGAITDPTNAQHGNPAQVPTTVALNANDPDGDDLDYTVTLSDPLYNLRVQFGLTNSAVLFNNKGRGEWYYLSTNGSNPGGGGYYLLTSENKLYRWTGTYPGSATAANLVADFNLPLYARNVYAQPNLIPRAVAPTTTGLTASAGGAVTVDSGTLALVALRAKYGLTTAPTAFNFRGAGEWYFTSTNGSNATNLSRYVLLPNNTLVAWRGTLANSILVADFANDPAYGGKNVYGNPALLWSASAVINQGVTAEVEDLGTGTLTLTPMAGFEGSLGVTVTANDGVLSTTEEFRYTVTNAGPVLAPLGDVSVAHNVGTANVPLNYSDPQNDVAGPVYRVDITGFDPFYELKVKYGLTNAATDFNFRGFGEWYFTSTNGSNASQLSRYVLVGNKLYAWQGTYALTVASTPVADFITEAAKYGFANVSAAPSLISGAQEPAPAAVNLNRGPLYDVQVKYGLTSAATAFNFRGFGEWYFTSTNGSNAGNLNRYVLVPSGTDGGGKLYAWAGTYAATIAQQPVVDLSDYAVVSNPALLTGARPTFIGDPFFDLKTRFGLTKLPTDFNFRGFGEYYFTSTNGSNASQLSRYVLVSNKLYAWQGTYAATVASTPVADFTNEPKYNGADVSANPALLVSASGQAAAVTGTVSGNTLTLTGNPAFAGTVRVTVTASDGARTTSQSFLFTVTNATPTLDPIANQEVTGGTGTTVPLIVGDADGETPQGVVAISGNPLADLKTKFGLTNAATLFNNKGQNEWYFQSTNGSNPGGGGFFVLTTDNMLYRWTGTYPGSTTVDNLVADFNAGVFNGIDVYGNVTTNQLYLANQTAPNLAGVSGMITGTNLNLSWPSLFTGTFTVTLTFGDGASEIERSFLVTVSP